MLAALYHGFNSPEVTAEWLKAWGIRLGQPKLAEIKLRPKTGDHDLETKLNHARDFLKEGDRVRFVMRLRGRENAYLDRWCEALTKDLEALADMGHMSVRPRAEGKAIVAQIDPK